MTSPFDDSGAVIRKGYITSVMESSADENSAGSSDTVCHKRPIVIDGQNISCLPGKRGVDSKRCLAAISFFRALGHTSIAVVFPQNFGWERRLSFSAPEKSRAIRAMEPFVVLSPARYNNGTKEWEQSDDDMYLLDLAKRSGAVVVSNDQYRVERFRDPSLAEVIDKRLLAYTISFDSLFQVARDPLGKNGVTLEEVLHFPAGVAPPSLKNDLDYLVAEVERDPKLQSIMKSKGLCAQREGMSDRELGRTTESGRLQEQRVYTKTPVYPSASEYPSTSTRVNPSVYARGGEKRAEERSYSVYERYSCTGGSRSLSFLRGEGSRAYGYNAGRYPRWQDDLQNAGKYQNREASSASREAKTMCSSSFNRESSHGRRLSREAASASFPPDDPKPQHDFVNLRHRTSLQVDQLTTQLLPLVIDSEPVLGSDGLRKAVRDVISRHPVASIADVMALDVLKEVKKRCDQKPNHSDRNDASEVMLISFDD